MSVFKVQLTQGVGRTAQGYLDPSVVNGASIQRTIYAPGPNKINRVLFDGQTFTDVNYWKRFTYPTLPYEQAFITVVTDDGSVWNDFSAENTFPRSYSLSLAGGSTYSTNGNTVNVLTDNGSPAVFTQITNLSGSGSVNVRVNGLANAIVPVAAGTTQVFDKGDLAVTKLEFDNSASGAGTATISVFLAIQSQATS